MHTTFARKHYQDELLTRHLRAYLGDIDPPALRMLQENLQWVELAGGETLMEQGDPGDSMYVSISGRLRAYIRDADGVPRMVREMSRGQVIGEMSLYTHAPRSATVVAVRHSVLVRLDKPAFDRLLAASPQVSVAFTRQIIKRLESTEQARSAVERPVTMALVPITDGVDLAAFAARLADQLALVGRVRVIDADALDRELSEPGIANADIRDTGINRRISLVLDEIEAAHDFVLLQADPASTAWTHRCSRHSDELLLLADATRPPGLHAIERDCLMQRAAKAEAHEVLVLLHPADTRSPRATRAWLERRPLAGHVHIRPALDRDMARLARIQSRTAIGLVFAGGGARGLAHLGIYEALKARGVEIDHVGGTSIGAIMATYVASDQPMDVVMANARHAFSRNPTGDFNLVPILSLIKGQRLRSLIAHSLGQLLGFDADIEDLWKNYFCIASNYSLASEEVLRHGNLDRAVRASVAIPGALPPVIRDGDLLCDGGTFNNFPVDVMRTMRGVGTVIGVDLNARKPQRMTLTDIPGSWSLLRDRLRARKKRHYRVPSLPAYLMNVTILYSTSRQRKSQQLTDVYFNPPLERVGMLEWTRFEQIVEQGRIHASAVLATMPVEQMRRLGLVDGNATTSGRGEDGNHAQAQPRSA